MFMVPLNTFTTLLCPEARNTVHCTETGIGILTSFFVFLSSYSVRGRFFSHMAYIAKRIMQIPPIWKQ